MKEKLMLACLLDEFVQPLNNAVRASTGETIEQCLETAAQGALNDNPHITEMESAINRQTLVEAVSLTLKYRLG